MMDGKTEIIVEDAIRKLVNRFKGRAYNFFTESDIHSYLYLSLYKKEFAKLYETKVKDNKDKISVLLLHREYPTYFRFKRNKKEKMISFEDPKASRGHYDLVILNPEFVKQNSLKAVINKDITIERNDINYNLLCAIEFKFIVKKPSKDMFDEINIDIDKLNHGDKILNKYLIICNNYGELPKEYYDRLNEISSNNTKIKIVYVESYIENGKKRYQGKYLTNNWKIKCPIKFKEK